MRGMHVLKALSALCFALSGCATHSQSAGVLSPTHPNLTSEQFADQFEATEFAKCIDAEGNSSGTLNFIWHVNNPNGEGIIPYIIGFSGSLLSLQGTKIEFQSLNSVSAERFTMPPVHNPIKFPLGSYAGFHLLFAHDELDGGWAFLRINDQATRPADVIGAELLLPKFALGDEYSTRYYMKIEGGLFHEFSCQAISDLVRARLRTFMAKNGLHGYDGDRGAKAKFFVPPPRAAVIPARIRSAPSSAPAPQIEAANKATATEPKATVSERDFRPQGRPANYDKQYKHTRIFECGKNGALDAIWRIIDENGQQLGLDQQYISGFAGEIRDNQLDNAFYFSSTNVDTNPAFYSGLMPQNTSYFFPSIAFSASDFKNNIALHSQLPGLKKNERAAAGTVYIPRNGTGRSISVSLAMGASLRAPPYQATTDCLPTTEKVAQWIKHCLGREQRALSKNLCQP
ncbi:hypothetical protein EBU99_08770 [bacterium]|nr:hypothetical protein [bacterium]